MLKIENLQVKIEDKKILNGVTLEIPKNEIHVLMGKNGSGKSTLAQALMGHPTYEVTEGQVLLDGKDLLDMEPNERALAGLFLSFQYPSEIPGVTISSYLRMIYNKKHSVNLSPVKFRALLKDQMAVLDIPEEFSTRYLNEGFSGGEKKRMEMLQMLILEPKISILDETDSGLDVDALKVVSESVNKLKKQTGMSVLLITHYSRILKHIEPDYVHIMQDGKIVQSGGKDLAHSIEENGYDRYLK